MIAEWCSRFTALAALGLLAVTAGGSVGSWHWLLDLMSHFRVQYVAIGIVLLILAAMLRSRVALMALGAAVAWNGSLIAPYYLPSGWLDGKDMPPEAPRVSLVAFNVLTSNPEHARVLDYLRQSRADIVGLTEIDDEWRRALEQLAGTYPHRLFEPRADNFGIAILSKRPWQDIRVLRHRASGVPSIVARFSWQGADFLLVITHPVPPVGAAHTQLRDADLAETAGLCASQPLPCVIMGDLNATPWSSAFRTLVRQTGLRDSALGFGIQHTWNAQHHLIRIPIDHILVPVTAGVEMRRIGPELGSDHFPVEATLWLRPHPRPKRDRLQ